MAQLNDLLVLGNSSLLGDVNFLGNLIFNGELQLYKHLYLMGVNDNSSVSNTSQIVFGTPTKQHIALSSNNNAFIINPSTSDKNNQIILYTTAAGDATSSISQIPSNLSLGGNLTVTKTSTFTGISTFQNSITLSNTASAAASTYPSINWGYYKSGASSPSPFIGYAEDQSDGTFILMSIGGGSSYKNGLAIGGSSGNLFWKGSKVAVVDDIPEIPVLSGGCESAAKKLVSGISVNGHAITVTRKELKAGNNVSITESSDATTITITASDPPTLSSLKGISSVTFAGIALTVTNTGASITQANARTALGLGTAAYRADGDVTPKAHTHTWSQISDRTTLSIETSGTIKGSKVYGSVWNDYAEYRQTHHKVKPGQCVYEKGDGSLAISYERMMPGANIVSDTFGFAIGETKNCKTPLAVSGRVLAYAYEPKETYNPGDAVCSGPNGTISKMTRAEIRDYPERIIGTVSEIPTYEVWGSGNIKVNGRIWIKVK